MKFEVKIDLSEVKRMQERMRKDVVPKAAARAINRVAESVRAEAVRGIKKHRGGLKQKTIREALAIRKAKATELLATVVASGRPIPLRDYNARHTRKGVTVSVSGPRKLVVKHGNKAFTVEKFGKHVFVRTGQKRTPITKLFGPSIPSAFTQKHVIAALEAVAAREWPKRFAHELSRALPK